MEFSKTAYSLKNQCSQCIFSWLALTKSAHIKNIESWDRVNLDKNTASMKNWWVSLHCSLLIPFPFGLSINNIRKYCGTSRKFLKYPTEWHFYTLRERTHALLSTCLLFWAHTSYPFISNSVSRLRESSMGPCSGLQAMLSIKIQAYLSMAINNGLKHIK